MEKFINVNQTTYQIIKLLGYGKGGYSYLAENNGQQFVLKQIHHNPCAYYTFGNKIESEVRDYDRLTNAGIRIPQMIDVDWDSERILKTYIEGNTIFELICDHKDVSPFILQVREMAESAKQHGLNIDYFPTNFVVNNNIIWYIDYECNEYMNEWNFENWGIKYWSRTPEFETYLRENPQSHSLPTNMLILDQ